MPRTSASNGIKPEIRALGVIKLNSPVTPKEINDHVKTGDYASKYVSFLSTRYGFGFTTQRDRKRVVSYTLVSEPKNVADLRAAQPQAPKSAPVVAKKVSKPVTAAKKEKSVKPAPVAVVQQAAAKHKSVTPKAPKSVKVDPVKETFGSTGSVGMIDPDWDSM